jgi:hypothetical protein
MTISIPQGALRDLTMYVQMPGWCKDISDIFVGGELLSVVFPKLDMSWMITQEALSKLSPADARTYGLNAEAWQQVQVTFDISDTQREKIRKAVMTVVEGKQFQITPFTFALLGALDFKA